MSTDRLVVVDTETFGLNAKTDFIIELGFKIIDLELRTIDQKSCPVWDTPSYDGRFDALKLSAENGNPADKFVFDMHSKSGLWHEARSTGISIQDTVGDFTLWLNSHGIDRSDPLVGSSVQFDREMLREHMPTIESMFSYRNIDTSTVKELCMRLNPRVYGFLDEVTKPKKKHRVDPDITDTIEELKFYKDEFLICDPNPEESHDV